MSPNFLGKVSPPGIFEFWHMVKCRFSELIKCLQLVKCLISEKYKTGKVSSSKTNKVSTLRHFPSGIVIALSIYPPKIVKNSSALTKLALQSAKIKTHFLLTFLKSKKVLYRRVLESAGDYSPIFNGTLPEGVRAEGVW